MTWLDILKRKRGNRRKRVPYNPFTGEGDKQTNIEDRMKAQEEKIKEREAKVAESFKKVPRARVAIRHGGGSKVNIARQKAQMAAKQGKEKGEDISLNPESRCAQCGVKLTNSQQTKTKNNASNLNYCSACARDIEGKPVASFRNNARGDLMPADNPKRRTPKGGRRGYK